MNVVYYYIYTKIVVLRTAQIKGFVTHKPHQMTQHEEDDAVEVGHKHF